MTKAAAKRPAAGGYEVGYGKPPKDRQFRKGQSGNPSGRPRGMSAGRAKALVLKEAYHIVIRVKEGGRVVCLPALGAILRSLISLAAKGNDPARRLVFAVVDQIEQELAAPSAPDTKDNNERPMTERQLGRRISWILSGEVPKGSARGA
jgi:hypothetical protein